MRNLIGVFLVAITLLPICSTGEVLAQEAKTTEASWTWSASGKHNETDLAQCPSVTGRERLELRFYKHEFGNIAVSLPESRDLKSYKSLTSQLSQNKVSVTLIFDGGPPVSETWAILQDPDSGKQLLAPRANYTKLYEQVLKSKQIAVSYPDKDGKLIESVFDVSATPAQVKAHNEKIHHVGVMDVLGGFTAF
jgi:hypothetical protein